MKTKNIMQSFMIASLVVVSCSVNAQVNNAPEDSVRNQPHVQKDEMNTKTEPNKTQEHQMEYSKTDYITMHNGKMVVNRNGKSVPMDKEMTMKNGTKYMVDGTSVTKDGKKAMLKDGEMIDMDGKMMMVLKKKDNTTK